MQNAAAESVMEELEVPAEIQRRSVGTSHATGCVLAAIFVLFPAAVYFGFFGLLMLDDMVFETHYAGNNLPQEALDWLVIVYWPLILVTRWALGIP